MTDATVTLVRLLADGAVRSQDSLCSALAIGRTELTRALERLPDLGLRGHRVAGGWRLEPSLNLLDAAAIMAAMDPPARREVAELIVLDRVDSTNAEIRRRSMPDRGALVYLAEHQSAGRGRHRRRWISPFGQGLCLSLGWRFRTGADLGGFSLALGVAVKDALAALGFAEIRLKWPNDVLAGGRKLGGILVEVTGAGPWDVVAGIGLNWRLAADPGRAIDQPWTDLAALTDDGPPERNRLAAGVIARVLAAQARFATAGLAPFVAGWQAADAFAGQRVAVDDGGARVTGTSLGISADGRLRIATAAGERRLAAGEINPARR